MTLGLADCGCGDEDIGMARLYNLSYNIVYTHGFLTGWHFCDLDYFELSQILNCPNSPNFFIVHVSISVAIYSQT